MPLLAVPPALPSRMFLASSSSCSESLPVPRAADPTLPGDAAALGAIGNSLGAALGSLDLLDESRLDPPQQECVRWARECTEQALARLASLIEARRTSEGARAWERVPLDPEAHFEPLLRWARAQAQARGLSFEVNWDEGTPTTVLASAGSWRTVLERVLDLAFESAESELRLDVAFRCEPDGYEHLEFILSYHLNGILDHGERLAELVSPEWVRDTGALVSAEITGEFAFVTVALVAERLPERRRPRLEAAWLRGKHCVLLGLPDADAALIESALHSLGADAERRLRWSAADGAESGPDPCADVDLVVLAEECVAAFQRALPSPAAGRIALVSLLARDLALAAPPVPAVAVRLRRPLLPHSVQRALAALQPEAFRLAASRRAPRAAALRVIVAEPEAIQSAVTARLLESEGHQVVRVEHGMDALARLEEESFDLALLCVELPRLDGISVARVVRSREEQRGGRLPIVALLPLGDPLAESRCMEAGIDAVLAQPLRREGLFWAVSRALGTARQVPSPAHESAPRES